MAALSASRVWAKRRELVFNWVAIAVRAEVRSAWVVEADSRIVVVLVLFWEGEVGVRGVMVSAWIGEGGRKRLRRVLCVSV